MSSDSEFIYSQRFLTEQYFEEKNDDVKQFLFKHLKKVRVEKNQYLYDCSQINEF